MARSTTDKWKTEMEKDATQELPLTLLTVTAPEDPGWHWKIVNDNDFFGRDAGFTEGPQTVIFDPTGTNGEYEVTIGGFGQDFFGPPPGSPQFEFMSNTAYFRVSPEGLNPSENMDGEWQIKNIIDGARAIVYPRRLMEDATNTNRTIHYMETFAPLNFLATLSQETPDTVPSIDISIGWNSPALVSTFAAYTKPPIIVMETVLKDEPNFYQMRTAMMEWTHIRFNTNSISGSVTGPPSLTADVPEDIKSPWLRPGLFDLL